MSNPDRSICEKYLEAIADNAGIELHPSSSSDTEDDEAEITKPVEEKSTKPQGSMPPSPPSPPAKTTGGVPDFDELTRRFEELRSKKP